MFSHGKSIAKAAALMLALALAACSLCACSNNARKPGNNVGQKSDVSLGNDRFTLDGSECFADSGFYVFTADADSEYSVKMEHGASGAEWSVYVLKDKFVGDYADLIRDNAPVLTSDGTIRVERFNYLYVRCSVNETNAESPAADASITFTGRGLPSK